MQRLLLLFVSFWLVACGAEQSSSPAPDNQTSQVNKPVTLFVYSARKEHLIKPLFDAYTAKTGVQIKYITDKAGSLLVRLKSEGKSTPADILLTTDVGNLSFAKTQGVLQPVQSSVLEQNIPAHLRDDENYWFGLTQRARTIVYASDRVDADAELSTYEALAGADWEGRLCLRTSKKVYNQSLVASLIAHLGQDGASAVVSGWVNNLAVAPFSNDTAAMKAVIAGQCDVTLVNTYYYGRLEADGEAASLKLYWPNQGESGTGVHVNISGAGITKHAKHVKEAQALIEWLSGTEAQGMLAGLNLEFPVNQQVPSVEQVKAWGDFQADTLPLSTIADFQIQAVQLIDSVGYR